MTRWTGGERDHTQANDLHFIGYPIYDRSEPAGYKDFVWDQQIARLAAERDDIREAELKLQTRYIFVIQIKTYIWQTSKHNSDLFQPKVRFLIDY